MKNKVQELLFGNDESIEHNGKCSNKYKAEGQENDAPTEELQNRVKKLKEREHEERSTRRSDWKERLHQRYADEKGFETMWIELRQIFGQKTEENSCKKFRENPVKLVNLKVQI